MTHLLVTNDFPPKVGGIQAYLWELWRRLDPSSFAVLTASSHRDAQTFDREQAERGIRIERVPNRVLVPTPKLIRRIRQSADRVGADLVVLDPAFPLGAMGPRLGLPYAVILHGAEVAIPGRLPVSREVVAPASSATASWPFPPVVIRPSKPPEPSAGEGCLLWCRSPPGSTCTGFGPSPSPSGRRLASTLDYRPTGLWWSA